MGSTVSVRRPTRHRGGAMDTQEHAAPEPDLNGTVQSAFIFLNPREVSMVLVKATDRTPGHDPFLTPLFRRRSEAPP
jgi:hypothetical protein